MIDYLYRIETYNYSTDLRKINPEIAWSKSAALMVKLIRDYVHVNRQVACDLVMDVLPVQKKESQITISELV